MVVAVARSGSDRLDRDRTSSLSPPASTLPAATSAYSPGSAHTMPSGRNKAYSSSSKTDRTRKHDDYCSSFPRLAVSREDFAGGSDDGRPLEAAQ